MLTAGHPLLDLLTVMATAVLLLIGYVVVATKDEPFRRVQTLLCLMLNRRDATTAPPPTGPQRHHDSP